jgi:hypothetical protein
MSEAISVAVVSSVFVENYQSDRLPHQSGFFSLFALFFRAAVLCTPLNLLFGCLPSFLLTSQHDRLRNDHNHGKSNQEPHHRWQTPSDDARKGFRFSNQKTCKACCGWLEGNFFHRNIQHKTLYYPKDEARGPPSTDGQQGYDHTHGSHMVTPSGHQAGVKNQGQKATRGEHAAKDGSLDANGSGHQSGILEFASRHHVS